ncbi:MAG: hypothetical protein FWH21_00590 [Kiritimatiellaeota bacterium]|nr:hypothetical protein [Kiritimatiellota bacterium]
MINVPKVRLAKKEKRDIAQDILYEALRRKAELERDGDPPHKPEGAWVPPLNVPRHNPNPTPMA